jgi:hypothetical protein
VVGAQNITAGSSITVYAITRDANGSFVGNPSATWSLQNITGGVVSGDLVAGGASAVFTGHLVGSANIQAIASTFTGNSGTQTVVPGAANKLAFTTQPVSTTAGATMASVVVQIQDANGNAVSQSGTAITLTLNGSTLYGGTNPRNTAAGGAATFNDLVIRQAGSGLTLAAAGGGLTGTTSSSFNITAAGANKLVFTTQPANTTAGATMATVVVQIQDIYGNAVAQSGTAVTLTLNGSTLYSGTNPQNTDGTGKATFNNLVIRQAGTGLYFSAAGGSLAGVTSTTFNITAGAVTAAQSTVSAAPASVTADGSTTSAITVTLNDANSNPVSGKTVTLAKTSGPGTPTITTTQGTTDSSGHATFTVKSTTAGADIFTATDTTDSVTVTQTATVTFTAGAANAAHSTLSPAAVSITAGGSTTVLTVQARDVNNNNLTTGGSTVVFSLFSGTGSVGSTTDHGNGTYTATVTSPTATGSGTFTATLGGTTVGTAVGASQSVVTYIPGAADATQSTLTPTSASITANGSSTQILTVQAKDAYGNNLTTGGATVTITKSSGTGTISSPVTDVGNGTYTATVTAPTATGSGVFVATLGGAAVKTGTGSQTQATVTYTASSANALTSSVNPALPGASVMFTSTLTAVAPSTGTPTGTVTFKDGAATLGTGALNGSGVATFTTSALSHGNHSITAEYAGDTYFLGSTSSPLAQTIDTPPVGGTHHLVTTTGKNLVVSVSTLANLDYDADHDTLTITAVDTTSQSGSGTSVALTDGGTTITYSPGTYVRADQFTYTISDNYTGGTATSTASVMVRLSPVTYAFYSISVSGGSVYLRGYGIPGHSYDIQKSTDNMATWSTISGPSGVTPAANGIILYTDTLTSPQGDYRLAVH